MFDNPDATKPMCSRTDENLVPVPKAEVKPDVEQRHAPRKPERSPSPESSDDEDSAEDSVPTKVNFSPESLPGPRKSSSAEAQKSGRRRHRRKHSSRKERPTHAPMFDISGKSGRRHADDDEQARKVKQSWETAAKNGGMYSRSKSTGHTRITIVKKDDAGLLLAGVVAKRPSVLGSIFKR